MAAVLTAPQLTALEALPNLEQQVAYVAAILADKENTYNTANPNNTFDNIVFDPNPNNKELSITLTLPMADASALLPAHTAVTAYLA